MSGIRCDVCDSGGVLSMHWSQSFALCDEHRHAPAKAAAIHSAEREVLEACVEESKALDDVRARPNHIRARKRHTDAIYIRAIKVRSYRALIEAESK